MTYLPGMTDERAREANIKAIELAQKAIETDPNCVLGYLADCIGKGRLALLSDNRSKVRTVYDFLKLFSSRLGEFLFLI